jgi:hypothetical protein
MFKNLNICNITSVGNARKRDWANASFVSFNGHECSQATFGGSRCGLLVVVKFPFNVFNKELDRLLIILSKKKNCKTRVEFYTKLVLVCTFCVNMRPPSSYFFFSFCLYPIIFLKSNITQKKSICDESSVSPSNTRACLAFIQQIEIISHSGFFCSLIFLAIDNLDFKENQIL